MFIFNNEIKVSLCLQAVSVNNICLLIHTSRYLYFFVENLYLKSVFVMYACKLLKYIKLIIYDSVILVFKLVLL